MSKDATEPTAATPALLREFADALDADRGHDKSMVTRVMRTADRICFACGATDVDLSIDHDHACCPSPRRACGACVRGLLCRNCNQALGRVGDSKEHLLALVAYLERWERRASESA